MNKFTELKEIADESYFIFKHSNSCPISGMANRVVTKVKEELSIPIYILIVQTQRSHSTEIAEHFNIRHESPQLLLVSKGKVVWHESHMAITKKAILRAAASI